MIKRSLIVSTTIAFAATALIATTPAQAAPYKVIKWKTTHLCQVYDFGWGPPILSDFRVMTKPMSSFDAALKAEKGLLRHGKC